MQHMSRAIRGPNRVAGMLLVASFLIPLLALMILVAGGAFSAFAARLQGSMAATAPYAATFRQTNLLYALAWIVQLLGFGLLTQLLLRAGDQSLAVPAFIAMLIAALLGFLHGTFHMSVETWAAEATAQSGSVPQIYEALDAWVGACFRVAYVTHLAATAVFGWAILRSKLLPSWVGRVVVGWSLIWLVGYFVGAGAPGILFIMPAGIGLALLVADQSPARPRASTPAHGLSK